MRGGSPGVVASRGEAGGLGFELQSALAEMDRGVARERLLVRLGHADTSPRDRLT